MDEALKQRVMEHIEDIIVTAETFHDERGFSTQTLYPMDVRALKDALDLLRKHPQGEPPVLSPEKIMQILDDFNNATNKARAEGTISPEIEDFSKDIAQAQIDLLKREGWL